MSRDVPMARGHLMRSETNDGQPRSDRCVEAPPVGVLLDRPSSIPNPPNDLPSSAHPGHACPDPKKVDPKTARNTHINTEPMDHVHRRPPEPTVWLAGTTGQEGLYRGIAGEHRRQHSADPVWPDEVFHPQVRRARRWIIDGRVSLDPHWTYARAGHGQKESQP